MSITSSSVNDDEKFFEEGYPSPLKIPGVLYLCLYCIHSSGSFLVVQLKLIVTIRANLLSVVASLPIESTPPPINGDDGSYCCGEKKAKLVQCGVRKKEVITVFSSVTQIYAWPSVWKAPMMGVVTTYEWIPVCLCISSYVPRIFSFSFSAVSSKRIFARTHTHMQEEKEEIGVILS